MIAEKIKIVRVGAQCKFRCLKGKSLIRSRHVQRISEKINHNCASLVYQTDFSTTFPCGKCLFGITRSYILSLPAVYAINVRTNKKPRFVTHPTATNVYFCRINPFTRLPLFQRKLLQLMTLKSFFVQIRICNLVDIRLTKSCLRTL